MYMHTAGTRVPGYRYPGTRVPGARVAEGRIVLALQQLYPVLLRQCHSSRGKYLGTGTGTCTGVPGYLGMHTSSGNSTPPRVTRTRVPVTPGRVPTRGGKSKEIPTGTYPYANPMHTPYMCTSGTGVPGHPGTHTRAPQVS
eukprot:1498-Rhodomonas_salina.1